MQTDLRLVHKQHIGLVVLHQHSEQDGQHLLLTARQLVGHQRLANLRETDLVLRPHDLLARLFEELVDDILESLLGLRQMLGGIGIALLQFGNDTVADVHLVVQILTLKVIQLEVESRRDASIHMTHRTQIQHGTVQRTDEVETDVRCVLGFYRDMYALQQMVNDVAIRIDTLHHPIQDGRLAHTIDTAEHVDMRIQLPHDVFLTAP